MNLAWAREVPGHVPVEGTDPTIKTVVVRSEAGRLSAPVVASGADRAITYSNSPTQVAVGIGGRIVPQSETTNREPDSGHVHVFLDGKLLSMLDGLDQDLRGLTPGFHDLRAEFVAADHGPFESRVIAGVLFKVEPP